MKRGLFNLQYEPEVVDNYTEPGSIEGAKMASNNAIASDMRPLLLQVATMNVHRLMRWVKDGNYPHDKVVAMPITTSTPEALNFRLEGCSPQLLIVLRPLHTIGKLDAFLEVASRALSAGSYMVCRSMTAALKRKLLTRKYIWGVRQMVIAADYIWNRVFPKLRLTHRLYFEVTQGKQREMSRVEIIGRLYRAGFVLEDERFVDGEFSIIVRKVADPVGDAEPTGSPIIHLRRIGKGGDEIVVHKFRTMYTYSEYIQDYVYNHQHLDVGGKFKDDYRVNMWGHVLRHLWLDELPMLWNMLRGDIKLVGVRPLSRQYFDLYTPEMQTLRIKAKPGLLPPFYYEDKSPETIEEVQESERRYMEAYLQHPFATDWRYFWGIVANILFHHKRSK